MTKRKLTPDEKLNQLKYKNSGPIRSKSKVDSTDSISKRPSTDRPSKTTAKEGRNLRSTTSRNPITSSS